MGSKKTVTYNISMAFLVVILLLTGCASHYQPLVPPTEEDLKPLEFSEIVSAEGFTKDQLYSAALAWYGNAFRSAKAISDVQDREAGRIIGKPLFQYEPSRLMGSVGIRGVVRYSIMLEVKDDRYRYTIGNFTHEGSGRSLQPSSIGLLTNAEPCPYTLENYTDTLANDTWKELKMRAKNEAAVLISSLKKSMATQNFVAEPVPWTQV